MIQQTLTGDRTDQDRIRPDTFVYCPECEDAVLRSRMDTHEHEPDKLMAYEKARLKQLAEQVPDHAKIETQTWLVDFHYTCVERVKVEASDKHDAKRTAEMVREYDGEIQETVHTEKRAIGEKSAATIEYLEDRNLLPDDHDLTQEELEQVIEHA